MTPTRLLVFSNIIAPYRVAFFNVLNEQPRIELYVVYLAHNESNRSWVVRQNEIHYPHCILRGLHFRISRDKTLHVNVGVREVFDLVRPDVIVLATDMLGSSASWCAWWLARRRQIPIIRHEARHQYTVKSNVVKDALFEFFVRRVDHVFAYSVLTKDYLNERHGVERQRITVGYNVGDSRVFSKCVLALRSTRECMREREQMPDVVMLFVGHLNQGKNILGLLSALKGVEERVSDGVIVFIAGDGPLRNAALSEAEKLRNIRVVFLGYLQREELIRYYALADVFLLPTLCDAASIALTEALHSGLFVVASNRDGSSANFIRDNENGVSVDPADNEALGRAIITASQRVRREARETRSRRITASVSEFTIENYARRLAEVVEKLHNKSVKPSGMPSEPPPL